MKFKEIHPEVTLDSKAFLKQKKLYNTLIKDLKKAVVKYNVKSNDGYGASLISYNDLVEFSKLGNIHDAKTFYQQIDNFWKMNIALTYRLAPIPLEDLL
ncbi:hypothetical protein INP83_05045 [Mucilaginibacter sp. 21P]|uniref:hypothetical protein n=1 Tax=Mucilaginibacter sp. 21P TaxID=2778902 RepID=UPI001C57438A|nr:hypothetical protein [Mucilaginibacter sp. 21P]QXV66453.1 hypothetical protein INP83_05045 [Mucilaginibacter sp. 21P]